MDPQALADRADRLQQGREADKRQRVREAERLKEQERVREQESRPRHRDRGMDYGM